jgi:hypothetical protein
MHGTQHPLPEPQRNQSQHLRYGSISISDLLQHDPKPPQFLVPGESLCGVEELSGLAEIAVLVTLGLQAREQLIAFGSRRLPRRGVHGIIGAQPVFFPEDFAAPLASIVGATVTTKVF